MRAQCNHHGASVHVGDHTLARDMTKIVYISGEQFSSLELDFGVESGLNPNFNIVLESILTLVIRSIKPPVMSSPGVKLGPNSKSTVCICVCWFFANNS